MEKIEDLIVKINLYFMFGLFKEKTITLANGQKVKEGDKVYFINSDGVKCEGVIERRLFDCTHSDTKVKIMIKRLFEKLKALCLYFVSDSTNDCTCGQVKRCGQRSMYCPKNDWWYRH